MAQVHKRATVNATAMGSILTRRNIIFSILRSGNDKAVEILHSTRNVSRKRIQQKMGDESV